MQSAANQKASGKRLWNKEEDDQLRKIVTQLGDNMQWAVISQKFNEKMAQEGRAVKRTNKQCRERQECCYSSWQNHLNPALSNNAEWSLAEHHMLFTLLRQHSQQWSQISARLREGGFGCRSDNHIKNYFYSSIKKAIKRINEILRNRNRLIKKQKSIMLNYNEKYAYQRHLSLQRQVQIPSHLHCRSSTNVSNSLENEDKLGQIADLKIIKELDQEIVRKILLIAESKGAKKFTISYKKYEEDAISTRDRLIDFIQNDSLFQDEDIISLASQILELSKKCKRKSRKNQSLDDQFCEEQISYREVHYSNSASGQFKKNASRAAQQSQIYSQQIKQQVILQSRLFCEQQIITREYVNKNLSNETVQKSKDDLLGIYNTSKNMFLDQSNPYLFGSECYYLNEQPQQQNEMINNEVLPAQPGLHALLDLSQSMLEANQQYELPLELLKVQNAAKIHASSGEFEFLNSIQELNPIKIVREHEELFSFDLQEDVNPFFEGANNISFLTFARRKAFDQEFEVEELAPSDLVNKNRVVQEENQCHTGQVKKKLSRNSLLNRSWAYSSNLLEICRIPNSQNFGCTVMRSKISAPL